MATTRAKANLPVNYEEQLAKEAAEIAKRISAPTGDRIRFNANRAFITPDGMEGETLEVVIVNFVSSNLFYDGLFDRDNPQPPGCFAIGPEPSLLVPSPNSPNKQAETCSSCPNNQFGSAQNGKGKACKNTRLLALMPASALDNPKEEAPIWILSVPPTSLKAFDSYVHTLSAKHKTVPVGVAYAIWSGLGIVLVSIVALVIYQQKLDLPAMIGMGLIVAGVVFIQLFSKTAGH